MVRDAGEFALRIEIHPLPAADSSAARVLRISPEDEPLWAALEEVTDPEFPVSVVDLGLIYGLQRLGESVHVDLTFTAMGCPCMGFIIQDIRERLLQEPEVSLVEIRVVWDPPWTRERLSARAIERLQEFGVTV